MIGRSPFSSYSYSYSCEDAEVGQLGRGCSGNPKKNQCQYESRLYTIGFVIIIYAYFCVTTATAATSAFSPPDLSVYADTRTYTYTDTDTEVMKSQLYVDADKIIICDQYQNTNSYEYSPLSRN